MVVPSSGIARTMKLLGVDELRFLHGSLMKHWRVQARPVSGLAPAWVTIKKTLGPSARFEVPACGGHVQSAASRTVKPSVERISAASRSSAWISQSPAGCGSGPGGGGTSPASGWAGPGPVSWT